MLFHSTRGNDSHKSFKDIAIQGLATDGGLYVPDFWPQIDLDQIKACKTYSDVAKIILPAFASDSFDEIEIRSMVDDIWQGFPSKDLVQFKNFDDFSIAELFHGPTAAFKDFGLQLVSYFLHHILKEDNQNGVILGATSGDTGSAAIHACKEYSNIKTFILLPEGNMSEVQRRQMSTVKNKNIFAIKVSGTFDDCQDIVKQAFNSDQFLPQNFSLLAVNSINWLRIIAQICYYFYSFSAINITKPLCFSIPSGNFGNVFSAYAAYKMGLPIKELCVAVNDNDILDRFFKNNDYSKNLTVPTISPSMDISVASNFERLIYDYYLERDAMTCNQLFTNFKSGKLALNDDLFKSKSGLFSSTVVSQEETRKIMKYFFDKYKYVLDPHSAIACKRVLEKSDFHVVSMATAHPDKFPDLFKALDIPIANHHPALQDLSNLEERLITMPCDFSIIKNFINNSL